MNLQIRELQPEEIEKISELQPTDWSDIIPFFHTYLQLSDCFPFVASNGEQLIGLANVAIHGTIGWVGHVIISPDFQRRGIGHRLVSNLIEFMEAKGVKSIVLIASKQGKPLYEKFGFRTITSYITYERKQIAPPADRSQLRMALAADAAAIYAIDLGITGEDRSSLLQAHLEQTWVYEDEAGIQGIYVPTLGYGPILAETEQAGTTLLQFKQSFSERRTAVPAENQAARSFLQQHGFSEANVLTRMIRGEDIKWYPEKIYGQIHGSFG